MRIALSIILFFLFDQTSGQILQRADSLHIKYYEDRLKGKKSKIRVWFARGYDNNMEENNKSYESKVDSLKIICLSEVNVTIELAVFDDFNSPKIFVYDSCDLFKYIKTNQDSLSIGYGEERQQKRKRSKAENYQRNFFEVIFFTIPKLWYKKKQGFYFKLYDKIYDTYGINVENDPWYDKIRFIIDSLILMSENTGK